MIDPRKKALLTCLVIGVSLGSILAHGEIVQAEPASLSADVENREPGPYKDGDYSGTAEGYNGNMTVKVKIVNGWIGQAEIAETGDDQDYLAKIEPLIAKVLEDQSTKVDTISGATFSSCGFLDAIDAALAKAKK
ncbi:FMN-binding protein [Peptococcus simiae]|uniref:FMN-binding protein n=1 Tax=Peptococcus simiae TaxID=1643805 RepID=A0ABW9H0Q4_9FIRM